MVSLGKVEHRFEIPLTIIEGGSGTFHGVLSESDQKQIPVNSFVTPRHVLRTTSSLPLKAGMVVRTPSGAVYIIGTNGPSEQPEGTLWNSWQLFQVSRQVQWQRRKKVTDLVTRLETDQGLEDKGMIWVGIEFIDHMVNDSRMRVNFSQSRIITGQPVQVDDIIDGRKVTRVDPSLGLTIGVIT